MKNSYNHFFLNLQGDFGTQKEAAWAISNLTISGRKDQVSLEKLLGLLKLKSILLFYV